MPCGSVREHDSDGMMLHHAQAQAQLQLEGVCSCILPSLSKLLMSTGPLPCGSARLGQHDAAPGTVSAAAA